MAVLRIPTPLRNYTNGQAEVPVKGGNIAEAMNSLVEQYPALKPHLYSGEGTLRPFVNLFVGQDNVRDLQGLETPVSEETQVRLIPSIAGGSR
ncbi:MAG TPA: MoaD/ThiS family protein [Anaerolineales bacterium]|nr:MoaD/ThiS family protein [Anaerolineales bacterium]